MKATILLDVYLETMTDEQAENFQWNPFDLTKVWPHGDFPLQKVGRFELNRNPENFFAEVEQAGVLPGNVPPGISWFQIGCCKRELCLMQTRTATA